jgi:hypothetical protein
MKSGKSIGSCYGITTASVGSGSMSKIAALIAKLVAQRSEPVARKSNQIALVARYVVLFAVLLATLRVNHSLHSAP